MILFDASFWCQTNLVSDCMTDEQSFLGGELWLCAMGLKSADTVRLWVIVVITIFVIMMR